MPLSPRTRSFGKSWGDDAWCNSGARAQKFNTSPSALAAINVPIADTTATIAAGGTTEVAPVLTGPGATAASATCDKADFACVDDGSYCQGKAVVACPTGEWASRGRAGGTQCAAWGGRDCQPPTPTYPHAF